VLLYLVIFSKVNIYIRLILVYLLMAFTTFFLFIIFTASSVNYEANKTYKLLNSLFVFYNSNRNKYKLRLSTVFKVNIQGWAIEGISIPPLDPKTGQNNTQKVKT
jgi:ABC-type multidrug transport system permease subunit